MAKFGTTSGRMIFGQMYPPVEASCSQVWNYFGQDNLWSDVPPNRHLVAKFETTSGRMTFGQMNSPTHPTPPIPCVETSHGQVWYYFGLADLWSDVPHPLMPPPHSRDISWQSVLLPQAG